MSRKKKWIYKKKGNIVKDLTKNIFKILKEDSQKFYNYKQIAAKLKIHHTDGKTQLIKKLAELTASKQIKEVERGSIKGFVCGATIHTLSYFLIKQYDIKYTKQILLNLLSFISVVDITKEDIQKALFNKFNHLKGEFKAHCVAIKVTKSDISCTNELRYRVK